MEYGEESTEEGVGWRAWCRIPGCTDQGFAVWGMPASGGLCSDSLQGILKDTDLVLWAHAWGPCYGFGHDFQIVLFLPGSWGAEDL